MTAQTPSPIAALRASLSGARLLGFAAKGSDAPQAQAAFVGYRNTLTVTSTADSGAGSLRAALAQNVTDGGNDQITFAPALAGQTISLQSTLTITAPVTIDGGGAVTVSGQNTVGVFNVAVGNSNFAELDNLTIANGASTGAAGASGAVNAPTSSNINGGAGGDAAGGVFVQSGQLFVNNDKFLNDTATGGAGGPGGYTSGSTPTKGAGGAGGNAAGAVYVEPRATVSTGTNLSSYNDTATAGRGGGSASGPAAAGAAYPVSNNSTVTSNDTALAAPCYTTGTLIRTARGDVAVEDLAVGDLVVTASGAHRPIRWIGSRAIEPRRHEHPNLAYPVRIAAHALGDNRPARDLFVSPGHAICVDMLGEVLVHASALVNGATIQQVDVDAVTYWHVELDSHDILLAENLPAESYLEMGNREFFVDGEVVALADSPDSAPAQRTTADFCRPFHEDGVIVEAIRAQLRRRACDLGWAMSDELDLTLEVDGRRIRPVMRGMAARFELPSGAKDVWLVSPAARPRDTLGTADARSLGVCVAAFSVDDGFGPPQAVSIADPLLGEGFHEVEAGLCRWTNGRARLPAALWSGCEEGFYLRVALNAPMLPRWRLPAAARPALALVG